MQEPKARRTTRADESPDFLRFWDAWRIHMNRNDGRGAARDEFTRHVERYGVDPADIADGALWFLHKGGNKGEYKVHAQTWINRRAYEDGADDWRKLQASIAARAAQSQSENVVQMQPRPKTRFMQEWERKQATGD
jgi:hypothetical protein